MPTLDPQDRLSLLASATGSIIWNAGPNGELLGEQPGWTAFTGQTSAELKSFGWAVSVHPDDRERAAAAWARALDAAEPAPIEFRLRRADGEYRDVLSRLVAVRGPDGSVREWIGVTTDLTERRSLEARALTDAERLRVTLSSIGDGVITTDATGLVEILNPVAEALTGWSQADAAGVRLERVFDIVNESSRERVENPALRATRDGRIVGLANHTVLIARDGRETPIDDSGAPIRGPDASIDGAVLVFRDVTERKQQEAALIFLAEASRILSSSLDYELTLQSVARLAVERFAEWCSVYVPAAGRPLEPLAVEHRDPAQVARVRELLERYPTDPDSPSGLPYVLRTGEPMLVPQVTDAMIEAAAKDAEHLRLIRQLNLRSALTVAMVADGRVVGALSMASSASGRPLGTADLALAQELAGRAAVAVEHARLHSELLAAHATLERRVVERTRDLEERTAELETFVYTASHDLRQPLLALEGMSELLETATEGGDKDEASYLAGRVRANTIRMRLLVDGLLGLARVGRGPDSGGEAVADLGELTSRVLDELRARLEERGVRVEAPTSWPLAAIPTTEAYQVLANLLGNAAKWSGRDGERPRVRLSWEERDQLVWLRVDDNGPGIPERHRERVFGLFQRLDARSEGTGVGLAIVKRVAERYGGQAWVRDSDLGGASFGVTLPSERRSLG